MKRLILLDDKVGQLADQIDDMRDIIMDHEKRLIRIETMIEMSSRQSGVDKLGDNWQLIDALKTL